MATNPPHPRLPVLVNLSTNVRYPLEGTFVTIGRERDNNVVITEDGYVSGHHARIYWEGGQWLLEDLKSSNGTTLNDLPVIDPSPLSPQDLIKFGRSSFRIE